MWSNQSEPFVVLGFVPVNLERRLQEAQEPPSFIDKEDIDTCPFTHDYCSGCYGDDSVGKCFGGERLAYTGCILYRLIDKNIPF